MALEVKCPNCGTSIKIGDGNGSVINSEMAKNMNGTAYLVPETVRNENCKCKGETNMKAEDLSTEELVAALRAKGLDVYNVLNDNGEKVGNYVSGSVEKKMEELGYIDFEKEHARFLVAETLNLLGWRDEVETKTWWGSTHAVDHWTENFNKSPKYDWKYQFGLIEQELHALAIIQTKDPHAYEIRSQFFNRDFVCRFLRRYTKDLEEYILREYKVKRARGRLGYKKCLGKDYVHYNGMDIFNEHIKTKVVEPLNNIISAIERTRDYREIERLYRNFIHSNKFCWKTKYRYMDEEFVDIFKGVGAYYSMYNLVKHSGLKLWDYEHDRLLNREDSLTYLNKRLFETSTERFKLMAILKNSLFKCDFHFNKEMKRPRR